MSPCNDLDIGGEITSSQDGIGSSEISHSDHYHSAATDPEINETCPSPTNSLVEDLERRLEIATFGPPEQKYVLPGVAGTVTRHPPSTNRIYVPYRPPPPLVPQSFHSIPQQDSQATLCSGISSPTGIYKIDDSAFKKDYTKLHDIGSGTFGKIELHKHTANSKVLVLKRQRITLEYIDGIPAEVYILRDVLGNTHPNISKICHYNHCLAEQQLWMPYCNGGDLYDLVRFYRISRGIGGIPEGFLWHTFIQLASACAYLHTGLLDPKNPDEEPSKSWHKVVHRDIKPDNVFLTMQPGQTYPTIVLGDFGLATLQHTTCPPHAGIIRGTPVWQPPELPLHTAYSDIWSVGAIIHYLAHGEPPIKKQPLYDIRLPTDYETDGDVREVSDVRTRGYSKYLRECLAEFLDWEREKRPLGLMGVLKAKAYRLLWTADGGEEVEMKEWKEWQANRGADYGRGFAKVRGFEDEEVKKAGNGRSGEEEGFISNPYE
ncbi:MAG: hypothetical protein Q9174_003371 [Haloplaca sp. 1 TL-2023]